MCNHEYTHIQYKERINESSWSVRMQACGSSIALCGSWYRKGRHCSHWGPVLSLRQSSHTPPLTPPVASKRAASKWHESEWPWQLHPMTHKIPGHCYKLKIRYNTIQIKKIDTIPTRKQDEFILKKQEMKQIKVIMSKTADKKY